MLVILVTIIIVAILIKIVLKLDEEWSAGTLIAIALVIAQIGLVVGTAVPIKYKDWEPVKRTEIVTLSNSTVTEGGGCLYVSVSGENVYTYRYETNRTDTIADYKTNTISGNVVEREDINCKVPELIVERRKGKVTIWTLGLKSDTRYVFHVPYGTISHEVQLK